MAPSTRNQLQDAITWVDLVIIAVVYLVVIVAAYVLSRYSELGRAFFKNFSSSVYRVVASVVLLTLTGSVSLYYLEWLAIPVVVALFISAIVSVSFFRGRERLSPTNAAVLATLLIGMALPLGLTTFKRNALSSLEAMVVWGFLLALWGAGVLAFWILTPLREQVRPLSKTRTLLILVFLSWYCLLYSTGNAAAYVVGLTAALLGVTWSVRAGDRVLSVSLNTYAARPSEIALVVTTLVFCTILNFSLMLTKDASDGPGQTQDPSSLFNLNILMFVVLVLFLLALMVSNAIWRARPGEKVAPELLKRATDPPETYDIYAEPEVRAADTIRRREVDERRGRVKQARSADARLEGRKVERLVV